MVGCTLHPERKMVGYTIALFLFLQLSLLSSISAFNITYALENHSEFSTYNKLLSKTNLADRINSRTTITVMAVRNSPAMDFLASKSDKVITQVLATHVLLDYMDASKLAELEEPQTMITMWQQSGKAVDSNGQILVARVGAKAYFKSAVKGAKQTIKYVREVAAQPFNISLIEVNQPLFAPGLLKDGGNIPSGASAPASPLPGLSGEEAPSPDDDETAEAPGPDGSDNAPEEAPEEAPAPAPGSSPSPFSVADDKEVGDDDDPEPKLEKSAGNKVMIGGSTTMVMVVSAAAAWMAF